MCLVGVVVRRCIYFFLLLIPTPLVYTLFSPTFCSFKKKISFLFQYIFVIYLIIFSSSINKHTSDYWRTTKPYEGLHIMFYTRKSTHVRFISCDGRHLYDFKERGVDLEIEGVRYIEMHRGPHTYWARLLQGADISN